MAQHLRKFTGNGQKPWGSSETLISTLQPNRVYLAMWAWVFLCIGFWCVCLCSNFPLPQEVHQVTPALEVCVCTRVLVLCVLVCLYCYYLGCACMCLFPCCYWFLVGVLILSQNTQTHFYVSGILSANGKSAWKCELSQTSAHTNKNNTLVLSFRYRLQAGFNHCLSACTIWH